MPTDPNIPPEPIRTTGFIMQDIKQLSIAEIAIPEIWKPYPYFRIFEFKQDTSYVSGNSLSDMKYPEKKPDELQQLWIDSNSMKRKWIQVPKVLEGSPEDI